MFILVGHSNVINVRLHLSAQSIGKDIKKRSP